MAQAPGSVQNSTRVSLRGDEDELSPTTIVLKYLQGKGITNPSADDIRNAVKVMGRQPGTPGPDVGPEQGPQARIQAMPDNVAGKIEGNTRPRGRTGQATPRGRSGATPPMDRRNDVAQGDNPQTSASPGDPLGPIILAGGGPAALGYGMYRYFNRMPPDGGAAASPAGRNLAVAGDRGMAVPDSQAEYVGRGQVPPSGRMMDVPSADQIAGGDFRLLPEGAQETPFDRAMGRAVQPQVGLGQRGLIGSDAVNLSGVRPVVQPSDVIGSRPIPGVGDLDLANAATGGNFANLPAPGEPVMNPGEGALFPNRPRTANPAELAPSGEDLLQSFFRLFGGRR